MEKDIAKRHGITLGLSTIISACTVISLVWFVMKPFVVEAVASELRGKIRSTVSSEIQPTNSAFAVVLRGQIRTLRRQITSMQYRKERDTTTWTVSDAQELEQARADFDAAQKALKSLTQPNLP